MRCRPGYLLLLLTACAGAPTGPGPRTVEPESAAAPSDILQLVARPGLACFVTENTAERHRSTQCDVVLVTVPEVVSRSEVLRPRQRAQRRIEVPWSGGPRPYPIVTGREGKSVVLQAGAGSLVVELRARTDWERQTVQLQVAATRRGEHASACVDVEDRGAVLLRMGPPADQLGLLIDVFVVSLECRGADGASRWVDPDEAERAR